MTLSQLDLELMKHSNKEDKRGCLKIGGYGVYMSSGIGGQSHDKIIGSPFGWGRVCMLLHEYEKKTKLAAYDFHIIEGHFNKNPELYDMDCLSWGEETKSLVLEFLNSLSINK